MKEIHQELQRIKIIKEEDLQINNHLQQWELLQVDQMKEQKELIKK
jgi:hypothetical protein